jgi:hypothetical protein
MNCCYLDVSSKTRGKGEELVLNFFWVRFVAHCQSAVNTDRNLMLSVKNSVSLPCLLFL